MNNIRDRLMSRASVAAMAAFAPKPDPASTIPNFAERVDDNASGSGDDDLLDGLSAEEQAQFAAMNGGKPAGDQGNVDPAGDGAGEGGDDGTDSDLDGSADGSGDSVAAAGDGADGADAGKPDAQADDKRPPPRTISYGRHQKELAKAQKAADDLQARLDGQTKETVKEREERIKLNERTRLLLEAINTRQPPAAAETEDKDPEPDKDSDPLGHLEWRNRRLENTVNELKTGRQQEQQVTAAEREEQQVYGTFSADLEREAQVDPTFADAFVHLRETRFRELGYIYADVDITDKAAVDAALTSEQQMELSNNIKRAFYNEQIMVARSAMQSGKSPAKVVANLARARGFVPKAAAAAPDAAAAAAAATNGAAKPRNGAAPPARVEAAPQGTVSDQLEQIRQNAAASRSLSDAGGSPGGDLTPERLGAMDDAEFEELLATMPKARLDKLMGKGPGQ